MGVSTKTFPMEVFTCRLLLMSGACDVSGADYTRPPPPPLLPPTTFAASTLPFSSNPPKGTAACSRPPSRLRPVGPPPPPTPAGRSATPAPTRVVCAPHSDSNSSALMPPGSRRELSSQVAHLPPVAISIAAQWRYPALGCLRVLSRVLPNQRDGMQVEWAMAASSLWLRNQRDGMQVEWARAAPSLQCCRSCLGCRSRFNSSMHSPSPQPRTDPAALSHSPLP